MIVLPFKHVYIEFSESLVGKENAKMMRIRVRTLGRSDVDLGR